MAGTLFGIADLTFSGAPGGLNGQQTQCFFGLFFDFLFSIPESGGTARGTPYCTPSTDSLHRVHAIVTLAIAIVLPPALGSGLSRRRDHDGVITMEREFPTTSGLFRTGQPCHAFHLFLKSAPVEDALLSSSRPCTYCLA